MGEKYIYFPKYNNLYTTIILVYLFVSANKIEHVFKSNNIITLLCTELVIKYNKWNLEGDANPLKLLLHLLRNDVSCSNAIFFEHGVCLGNMFRAPQEQSCLSLSRHLPRVAPGHKLVFQSRKQHFTPMAHK